MIEAANKERDYALDSMEKTFSAELTKITKYKEVVGLELADLGARSTRITLTKARLTEQLTTFSDLKSQNEDVNLEDVVISFSSAQTLYQAALTAASNCVQQSLLDYI
jgi:flagellar hook-associated protein 3 FlgL